MIEFFADNGLPISVNEIPLTASARANLERILELTHRGTGWYRVFDDQHEVTLHYVAKDGTGFTTTIVWE